ncbi:ArsR/SmtB family transcription factor [Parasphingorhabdus flavimaris]|jgi:ubiquinone/menaquinone biosynthesis C-methylase UbiE|uniref:Metalloregulator ArsR/SmtB family transcription factor n=1 Tax=Parasphingorhabdus flavimaris TaxID=266812 RepID=A0ABX2MYF1_9SPHN|nr:metalloregulator ArsR/SmtB family transcription factor [Parasphingorhabdus flavimaris]NVD26472.1 metalloregulator ArsR/SmtB family transcription factor [Parasphingorhabdus flavimaris]|tara:strand:- start:17226 stop:18245 length:1020 start_codon:yes stop_codon:yes gene_type:complete
MDHILNIFRALADPTRLRIVLLLQKMELAVGELAQILDQSQPRISRHIRILDEAGLAERRKEGSWVFLKPGPASELEILGRIFRSDKIAKSEQAMQDQAQLSSVRKARAEMAERYFAAHAEEWDAIRSLHLPEAEVERAMIALMRDAQLGKMLDIGTGTGRMVELFGPAAQSVIALDKSPEMLRLARAKLLESEAGDGLKLVQKTDLKQGDFNQLPVANCAVDSVILHQVLHYAQHPEAVLAEVSRVLKSNGIVLIADFAAHDREDLRTEHAHARLGFSDDSMKRWLTASKLELVQTRTLDGGELTVKIWVARKPAITSLHPDSDPLISQNTNLKRAAS